MPRIHIHLPRPDPDLAVPSGPTSTSWLVLDFFQLHTDPSVGNSFFYYLLHDASELPGYMLWELKGEPQITDPESPFRNFDLELTEAGGTVSMDWPMEMNDSRHFYVGARVTWPNGAGPGAVAFHRHCVPPYPSNAWGFFRRKTSSIDSWENQPNTTILPDEMLGETKHSGGLVGKQDGVIVDSYYNEDLVRAGLEPFEEEKARNTEQMTHPAEWHTTYHGWDFGEVWSIDPGKNDGYPHLRGSFLPTEPLAGRLVGRSTLSGTLDILGSTVYLSGSMHAVSAIQWEMIRQQIWAKRNGVYEPVTAFVKQNGTYHAVETVYHKSDGEYKE